MKVPPGPSSPAKGFGGMLLIASVGLAILVFGGILTNVRTASQLRASTAAQADSLQRHAALLPLEGQISRMARTLQADQLPVRSARRVAASEIPALREQLQGLAASSHLTVVSLTHTLDSLDPEDFRLRFDLRVRGEYTQLPAIFAALRGLDFALRIEGFSIRALPSGQELQIIFFVGMT